MLPIETLEGVIDQARDDTATLHHLSVTCRAFLPRVRYHLFSYMLIQTVQQTESFRDFLDSCPWVLPLVQNISLSTFLSIDNAIPNIRLLDVVPAHLLSRLPNLRTWNMELRGSKSGPETVTASLSLNRLTLSCYQRYGSGIRNLELASIPFQDVSDFIGLVSAFTCLESLTCSCIGFRTAQRYVVSSHGNSETNARAKLLPIKRLHVGAFMDLLAVEYLLHVSQAMLNNLALTLDEGHYSASPGRPEGQLVRLMRLSTLTLIIPCLGLFWSDHSAGGGILREIRCATRILEAVHVVHTQEVRVEFRPDSIASLGCCLSSGPGALEACGALEEVLLAFPLCRVLCHEPTTVHRANRAEFWSPSIKRAFPRLDERGFLTFTRLQPTSHRHGLARRRAEFWSSSNTSVFPKIDQRGVLTFTRLQPTGLAGIDAPDASLGHEAPVECVVASPDGKSIMTGAQDGTIIMWDIRRKTIVQEWFAHRGHVHALALSPDGCRLVSADGVEGEPLTVWDIGSSDGVRKSTTPGFHGHEEHASPIIACAWSPDGTLIASAYADGTVRVWDSRTFEQCGVHDASPLGGQSSPRHLQFSPNSRFLAWASSPSQDGYGCVVWSPLGATEEHSRGIWLPTHPTAHAKGAPVNAIAFDPGSRRLATAAGFVGQDGDYAAVIWDVVTGAALAILKGHTQIVTDVSFSPDGGSVLSASFDGSAKIWDAERGEETASLVDGGSEILEARFSPDGMYVATASMDGTVQLWRVADGSKKAVFTGHRTPVLHVAFSPDGEFLASGDEEGVVHIRPLSSLAEL